MIFYFKKRKFRKFIKNCEILDDKKVRTKSWFGDLYYIKRGLKKWEQEILKEEIGKVEQEKEKEKEKEEMEQSRKEFFDTWKK